MKLDSTAPTTLQKTNDSFARTLSFKDKSDWVEKLTIGQILKGKILRSYGEGRYLVEFNGQQRVVDSTIPLTVGETIRGRIAGLSERVLLEHLANHEGSSSRKTDLPSAKQQFLNVDQDILNEANRLHLQLNEATIKAIASICRSFSDKLLATKAGLFVAKTGLPVSKPLIQEIYNRLLLEKSATDYSLEKDVAILSRVDVPTNESDFNSTVHALAQFLVSSSEFERKNHEEGVREIGIDNQADDFIVQSPSLYHQETFSEHLADDDRQPDWDLALDRLFNLQTGGSYQHCLHSLPILIDEKLVEFDLALFDQAKTSPDGKRLRQIRFSLTMPSGPVDVLVKIINHRVSLSICTENQTLLAAFEEFSMHLENNINTVGWTAESIEYNLSRLADNAHQSIVNHVLEQDSLRMEL